MILNELNNNESAFYFTINNQNQKIKLELLYKCGSYVDKEFKIIDDTN